MSVDKIHELEARIRALELKFEAWAGKKVAEVQQDLPKSLFGKKEA